MKFLFYKLWDEISIIRKSLEKQFLKHSEYTERFEVIMIQGSRDFTQHTKKALKLLRTTSSYDAIWPYLGRIEETKRSGMNVYHALPTFEVGPGWRHSDIWYASTIAHDGYHSLLYHQAKERNDEREPDADIWTGVEAERRCLEVQINTLKELHADQAIIEYVEELKINPTYQGDGSWEDYYKRDW